MTEQPLSISVVIPAYNASAFIGRALSSVFAQTQPADEILVIDDGSKDDLSTAIAPFADRVTLIRKPNGGASSARNLGLDRARGSVIAFLDADDTWDPEKLQRHVAILHQHPDIGFTAAGYRVCTHGELKLLRTVTSGQWCGRVLRLAGPDIFTVALTIATPTVVLRRQALGSHRFDETLRTAEDRDLWIRLLADNASYLLPDVLTTVVQLERSLSTANPDADYPNMLRVIRRYRAMLGPSATRKLEGRTLFALGWGRYVTGRPVAALPPLLASLARQPLNSSAWYMLAKCLFRALPVPGSMRSPVRPVNGNTPS